MDLWVLFIDKPDKRRKKKKAYHGLSRVPGAVSTSNRSARCFVASRDLCAAVTFGIFVVLCDTKPLDVQSFFLEERLRRKRSAMAHIPIPHMKVAIGTGQRVREHLVGKDRPAGEALSLKTDSIIGQLGGMLVKGKLISAEEMVGWNTRGIERWSGPKPEVRRDPKKKKKKNPWVRIFDNGAMGKSTQRPQLASSGCNSAQNPAIFGLLRLLCSQIQQLHPISHGSNVREVVHVHQQKGRHCSVATWQERIPHPVGTYPHGEGICPVIYDAGAGKRRVFCSMDGEEGGQPLRPRWNRVLDDIYVVQP